jgi:hypothetical protein
LQLARLAREVGTGLFVLAVGAFPNGTC